MALTLGLAHDTTVSSNDQKRACRSWEIGINFPEYASALCDDQERTWNEGSSRGSEEELGASGGLARKKLRLSKEESALLEERFKEQSTLTPKQKNELAKQLNLRPRQVEVWFQNRRARTKLKQTEVDCELLKKCCASLTEENRRLQKEVAQLRALKEGPHYMSPHDLGTRIPGTTVTMCAHCECISAHRAAPASSTTTSNSSLHQAPHTSSPKQQPSPSS
ncbi:hypothetical protein GOP47_0012791 [Adiantum capillus-veneris]|uniref:Homeobox domain-containing protein n=1 Tax=Adiantum capillus-veneris TaxID=13818 RepID=A0A9D4ZGU1_ADICA|nr:hypothetical protein GOP47_0012791 [Adiantum capillus-veneris]